MKKISYEDYEELEKYYSRWPTDHDDFSSTYCYPFIRPSIKPEHIEIIRIYHYGPCEKAQEVFCIHIMEDDMIIQHNSHPVGECPFCDYK
jgi:hypothetical protein